MKKILMLLAAASIVMTAIGCAAKEEPTTGTTATTTGSTGANSSQGSSETSDK